MSIRPVGLVVDGMGPFKIQRIEGVRMKSAYHIPVIYSSFCFVIFRPKQFKVVFFIPFVSFAILVAKFAIIKNEI